MSSRKRQRGLSVLEILFSVSIFGLVIAGALFALMGTLSAWDRGQARIQAELECQQALRRVTSTLQEAMHAQVDSDGMGITYRLPQKDAQGSILFPLTWDGVDRRIELDGSNLRMSSPSGWQILLNNVMTTDPNDPGGGTYRLFLASAGTTVRQVIVQIAVERRLRNNQKVWARARESVRLRNVPPLN
jgi:type II secretory pathway pseudopilin PulG